MMNDYVTKYHPFFSARYNTDRLVYDKLYDTIEEAIKEDERIKRGNRLAKIKLMESMNPNWIDLWIEEV